MPALVPGTRSLILVAFGLAGAVLSGLPLMEPDVAKARKGYGGGGYGGPGQHIAACKKNCGKARRTCIYCAKQDAREQMTSCAAESTSKPARRVCKQTMKKQVHAAAQACKGLTGQCGGCCRNDYSADCNASFAETPGYPGYFHVVKHYGKTRRYAPDCDQAGGSAGGACVGTCDRIAARASTACKKKGGDECQQAAEAQRLSCRAACNGETTTTSTLPGSASCESLNCDQFDDSCQDYSCQTNQGYAYCISSPKTPLPCDDGDACNGYETFDCATGCHPGTPAACGTDNFCYHYTCVSVGNYPYCNFEAKQPPNCDDGNACNGYETLNCEQGCVPGTDPCPPSDHCTTYECTSVNNQASCNPASIPPPPCDDGNTCNGTETYDCQQGKCVSGPPVFCPSGRHCVNDPPGILCVLN